MDTSVDNLPKLNLRLWYKKVIYFHEYWGTTLTLTLFDGVCLFPTIFGNISPAKKFHKNLFLKKL